MGTVEDALNQFRKLLGTREQPPGSNNVPGITDWLRTKNNSTTGPSPWCAETISRVLSEAGVRDLYGLQFENGCAYVPYITRAFRRWGRFFQTPEVGDLAIFVWGKAGSNPEGDHIGMVTAPLAGDFVKTIEGNADSEPSDGNGNTVAEHQRRTSLVLGYCRPRYTTVASPDPAPADGVPPPPFGHNLMLTSPDLMEDDFVWQWQRQMKARGWPIRVDGWYGQDSDHTCRQFQAEKNLVVDGIVGPDTWRATWMAPVV